MVRLFLIQSNCPIRSNSSIRIIYDSTSAGDCSFGSAFASDNILLARLTFSLHKLASRKWVLGASHVKAHIGDPWNEMADSLCSFFKTHDPHV